MNRLRNIVGLIAVCATTAYFTGCGEHDTTGGGNNNNNNFAPASVNGRTYSLTDAAGTSTLTFDPTVNNYTLSPSGGGTAETGTFTSNPSGQTWNVALTDSTGANTSQLTLTYTGSGVGTYTFQRAGGAQTSGNFSESGGSTTTTSSGTSTTTTSSGTSTTTTTDGTSTTTTSSGTSTTTTDSGTSTTTTSSGTSTTTTTDGTTTNSGTSTSTGGTVTPPAPADFKMLVVHVTNANSGVGQANYTVNLSGGPTGTFNITDGSTGSGTYTYTVNSDDTAQLVLNYGPPNAGDVDNMTLVFTTASGGGSNNFSGNQQVQNTQYPMVGTFTY